MANLKIVFCRHSFGWRGCVLKSNVYKSVEFNRTPERRCISSNGLTPPTHSLTHSFTYSVADSLNHSLSLTHQLAHATLHSLNQPINHSAISRLIRYLSLSHSHSLTHSLHYLKFTPHSHLFDSMTSSSDCHLDTCHCCCWRPVGSSHSRVLSPNAVVICSLFFWRSAHSNPAPR